MKIVGARAGWLAGQLLLVMTRVLLLSLLSQQPPSSPLEAGPHLRGQLSHRSQISVQHN